MTESGNSRKLFFEDGNMGKIEGSRGSSSTLRPVSTRAKMIALQFDGISLCGGVQVGAELWRACALSVDHVEE